MTWLLEILALRCGKLAEMGAIMLGQVRHSERQGDARPLHSELSFFSTNV